MKRLNKIIITREKNLFFTFADFVKLGFNINLLNDYKKGVLTKVKNNHQASDD